jgi:threonine/homoserine/homoserine lactone efflux protein
MFDIQNYTSFLAAILIFQLTPGAGTLAILNATARNGVGAGLGAVLGTIVSDFLFMVAAVAGLAAVMNANPILFQVLQSFGAAYLCWLGLQLLRKPSEILHHGHLTHLELRLSPGVTSMSEACG